MKFRLPKALLVAVLASTAAYADEIAENPNGTSPNIVTAENTLVVDTDVSLDATSEAILTQDKIDGAGNKRAYAIVKDGAGTLKVDGGEEYTVNNVLVVREGTLKIDNGSHVNNRIDYSNYVSNLTVGGKDAKLVLDNGSTYKCSSSSAISLGSVDGAAVVELNNKSTLQTGHYIMIGDIAGQYNVGGDYGPIGHVTYTTTDGTTTGQYKGGNERVTVTDAAGNEVTTTTYIKLDGGSTMSAGTSLQISDAVIDIVGGAKLQDATNKGLSNKSEEPESYFAYDAPGEVETKTIINVYDGELDCNWNLETGRNANSETRVTVNGANAKFSVAGVANFGGPNIKTDSGDIGRYDESKTSQTSIILKNGGTAEFSKVIMGDFRDAKITVDATSQILAHTNPFDDTEVGTIEVWEKGVIENSGKIALSIELNGGTFTMENGAVAAGLTATSGTINLSGNVTFTGAVNLGSVVAADPMLAALSGSESDTLTVYIAKDTNIVLDDSILSVDGQQFVVGDNTEIIVDLGNVAYAEGTPLFTLTGSNGTQLTNTAAALEDKMTVTWKDENGDTQSVSGATADMSGSITTNAVPEPTTATLSLLALAGLCARRRRK